MPQKSDLSPETTPLRLVSEIVHYHVHVYYDATTRPAAMLLREQIADRFAVEMGRLFEQAVGPHPVPQYQVAFEADQFARLVPWLMLNRHGLSILIHPNTDLEREDHFTSALWLGQTITLSEASLSESLQAAGQWPLRSLTINTTPTIGI